MPHVSKKKLNDREFQKIYKNFIGVLHKSKDKRSMERFFWEFLTPTEKIMLSKRLAMIMLAEKGVSSYQMWKLLGVSSSTADRISDKIDRGGYPYIVSLFRKKDSQLTKVLGEVLDILTPPPYYVSKEEFIRRKNRQK